MARGADSTHFPRPGRRDLLRLGGAAVAAGAAPGCTGGFFTTGADGEQDQQGEDGNPTQAPMLADRVREQDLPSLEERLPANPLVVEPVEEVGSYGGVWRTMLAGVADDAWITRTINYEHLLTWDRSFSEIQPNLAEGFEANDAATRFTITLREGVRWSDGEPFTADDILFAYEDVETNEELVETFPSWLSSGAKAGNPLAEVDKIDDYTIQFSFDEPNGLFETYLAELSGGILLNSPRHYLQRFHGKYNPDVEELADDEGFPDWVELFHERRDRWQNVGVPTLTAWMTEQALGDGNRFVVVRNPYYWKVDPDGSQLPYLDRVVFEIVGEEEVMILKINNGEIDMHCRHVNIPSNKPVFARNREDSDFDFFDIETTDTNQMAIHLNLTHEDPVLREVFQTKQFRVGLSHAIDRQEIIDTVFQQQGEPWQVAPRPESVFYDEEYARQYTSYDVDLANQILDDAGFAERDGEGVRLRPDGEPIVFDVDVTVPSLMTGWVAAMELVVGYWAEVGITARVNSGDRSLMWERMTSGQHDASVWVGEFGDVDAILFSASYVPARGDSQFAVKWGNWYESGGEAGMEPPEEVKHQFGLFDRVKAAGSEDERVELFGEVLAVSREQFYNIGVALPPTGYGIVKNTFKNVPGSMPGSFPYPTPAPTRPEQYFTTST